MDWKILVRDTHERRYGVFKNTPEGLPGCEELFTAFSCVSLRRISELFRRFFWPHGSLRYSDVRYEPVCALFRQVHGEWGGLANGELDDLSLRFPNIEFHCLEGVYLLWHMTTATLPGICNTVQLISFQSRNKTKPNLFFPIIFRTKSNFFQFLNRCYVFPASFT